MRTGHSSDPFRIKTDSDHQQAAELAARKADLEDAGKEDLVYDDSDGNPGESREPMDEQFRKEMQALERDIEGFGDRYRLIKRIGEGEQMDPAAE